jgi:hypothetical protein
MGRRIVWVLMLLLLSLTGALGVYNGISEWGDPHTPLQRSVTVSVFLYGIAGLAGAYGLVLRRRWSVWAAVMWGMATTYAGTVATIAYGGRDATPGAALVAGTACVLIAAATIWGVRASTRVGRANVDHVQLSER